MIKINMLFTPSDSGENAAPDTEYNISVTRGDGLPMTDAEVDATITMYMLNKLKGGVAPASSTALSEEKMKVPLGSTQARAALSGEANSPVLAKGVADRSMIEVINMHGDTVEALTKLPGKVSAVWHKAMLQLKAKRGQQIVKIPDQVAADQLAAAGLLTQRKYRGQAIGGEYIVPRTKAFCSSEPARNNDALFCAPIVSR